MEIQVNEASVPCEPDAHHRFVCDVLQATLDLAEGFGMSSAKSVRQSQSPEA
jgi:hypothetical protein